MRRPLIHPSYSPLLCFGGVSDSIAAAAKKILQSNYSKHSATVTRGKGGLGMAIEHEGASHLAAVRVGHLIAGKPVAESGLVKEGDLIVEINGHSTLGKSFDEIVGFLAGNPGDDVSMKLRRCDVKQTATWKSDSEKNWFVGEDVGALAPWFRDCPEKSVLVQASRANDPIAKATTALVTPNLSPELKHLLTTLSKELTQLLPKEAAIVRRSWQLSSEGVVAAPSSYSPKEDAQWRRSWQLQQ